MIRYLAGCSRHLTHDALFGQPGVAAWPRRHPTLILAAATLGLVSLGEAGYVRLGVVAAIDGSARVERRTSPVSVALRVGDDLFLDDLITVDGGSIARFLIRGAGVATLAGDTTARVEGANDVTLALHRGRIAYVVNPLQLPPGQAHWIQTPNALIRVVAGTLIVTIDETADSSSVSTDVCLITGDVPVTITRDQRAVQITKGDCITIGVTAFGNLRRATDADVRQIPILRPKKSSLQRVAVT